MLSMREMMNAWHNFMKASFDMYFIICAIDLS